MGEQLLWATKNGDMELLKDLVEKQNVSINTELLNGRMAIHYAADYGQLEVIEYLVSKGADMNQADKHGITPLLAAIFEGHTSCVKFFLSKGANKNGKAPDGSSYYDVAETDEIKALLK
ncbi:myotrophin-like [Rhopilema esculentum]|uniref:myotrophin-like n=1 Tax=Rhopilema esculentum TaxID=499914 RepID=UPI0031E40279|eukprot:gene11442-21645_t